MSSNSTAALVFGAGVALTCALAGAECWIEVQRDCCEISGTLRDHGPCQSGQNSCKDLRNGAEIPTWTTADIGNVPWGKKARRGDGPDGTCNVTRYHCVNNQCVRDYASYSFAPCTKTRMDETAAPCPQEGGGGGEEN